MTIEFKTWYYLKKAKRIIVILFVLVDGVVCVVSIAKQSSARFSKFAMKMFMVIRFALAIVAGYAANGGVYVLRPPFPGTAKVHNFSCNAAKSLV